MHLLRRYTDRIRHARRATVRRDRAIAAAERLFGQAALLGSHPLALAAALALGASERQARVALCLGGAR
jgi:hypothetical protein